MIKLLELATQITIQTVFGVIVLTCNISTDITDLQPGELPYITYVCVTSGDDNRFILRGRLYRLNEEEISKGAGDNL